MSETHPEHTLATLASRHDAEAAAYGLKLRSIPAAVRQGSALSLRGVRARWNVMIKAADLDRARDAWVYIVEALPESWRAVDAEGRCAFCKYDCQGLPRGRRCPECGVALDSAAARLAAHEGRRPAPDET